MFAFTLANALFAVGGAVAAVVSSKVYTFVKTKIVAVIEAEAAKIVAKAKAPVAAVVAEVKADVAAVEKKV